MPNQSKRTRIWSAAFYVVVFLVAFLLRTWHPVSRPLQWVERSMSFYNAVIDDQNWHKTFQRAHPGVTTMLAGGLTSRAYDKARGADTFPWNTYERIIEWAAPPETTEYGKQVVATQLGIAFMLALLITISVWALKKLGDWPLAISGAVFLGLSPFLLGHGRIVHLDAMISHLMLLSALLIMLYADSRQKRYFVFSGLAGGLSMLTKPVSIFMVPFTGLVLSIYLLIDLRQQWRSREQGRLGWLALQISKRLVLPLLLWLLLAAIVFAIWPSMWVQPVWSFTQIAENFVKHAGEAHPNPRFFMGQIYTEKSPGLLFYPLSLIFNASFITLSLSVVTIFLYLRKAEDTSLPLPRTQFWLLTAFVVFFLIQMSLGAKQTQRYILPAHAAFEVIATVGLAGVIRLGEHILPRRTALPGLIGVALALHLTLLAAFMPDMTAHKNHLLGGSPIARQVFELGGNNEGIIPVADYLNAQPDSERLVVGMPDFLSTTIPQYLDIQTRFATTIDAAGSDYLLYTAETFQRFQFQPGDVKAAPHVTVSYDGIPYMILYALDAQPEQPPITIRRGGVWLIALAWLWTLGLAALLSASLRKTSPATP